MDSKVLELLHQIELEYGSVTKCPDDDQRVLEARSILLAKEQPDDTAEKVKTLIIKGYSLNEVCKKMKLGMAKLNRIKEQNQLLTKPQFRYVATKGKYRIHGANMASIARALGYKARLSAIKSTIKSNGWLLWAERRRWEQVKNGEYYIDPDEENIYVKRGIDSYRKHRIYNLME